MKFAEHWIRSYVENSENPGEYFYNKMPGDNGDSNRNDVILENYRTTISANLLLFYILPDEYKKNENYGVLADVSEENRPAQLQTTNEKILKRNAKKNKKNKK